MSESKKTYTEAQKASIYRYREKNREKYNDQARKDYITAKEKPETLEKRRAYAKMYYQKKKEKEEAAYWDRIARTASFYLSDAIDA